MKKLKIMFITMFFILILIPVVSFNFEENVVSSIDNRELINNPFGENYVEQENVGYLEAIDLYVQDRIGFRDEMINIYTILNDKLFHEMVHPSYEYGIDGYVFNKIDGKIEYGEYHVEFAKTIKEIQTYCEDRGIPFVFVFEPAKTTVLEDKLDIGINYDTIWIDDFFNTLDDMSVNYVDNTDLLVDKTKEGKQVFNKKYDAGHWNDWGAFYGVNEVVDYLKKQGVIIDKNKVSDFDIHKKQNYSLPVSNFPINETEEIFEKKCDIEYITELYKDEIILDPQYQYFSYAINQQNVEKGVPKALVFQGSYINGRGYKFFENCLGEYIAIHDYQNVLNFDYYFNIFKPDCVIFEVAEYTLLDGYFSYEKMKHFDLNPSLDNYGQLIIKHGNLDYKNISIKKANILTTINIETNIEDVEYGYIKMKNEIFDMRKNQTGNQYEVTVETNKFDDDFEIVLVNSTKGTATILD